MELHEKEWDEAQKIEISVDLVAAAKKHLMFLAAVDRNRYLYEGPVLQRAIYRYNAFWLPLLAKHSESRITRGPLVVPLDCEWVWHCHRLNPVRYKSDCEKLYGRTLDNSNVISSLEGAYPNETKEVWARYYPEESYELNLNEALAEDISEKNSKLEECTDYDLVSAVKRQSPFFYQVSRPHMSHDVFLKDAVERYKGFLHVIRRNREKSLRRFCVPTYDIDLIWHTHQLHPVSYCQDVSKLLGKVLEHDDMDSDRTKGKKLDTGFSGTTAQWEETYRKRYWKAGAMYRGNTPSAVTSVPLASNSESKEVNHIEYKDVIRVPEVKNIEVILEFVGIQNLPKDHKGKLFVSFSKSQPDVLFNVKRKLSISSVSGEKMMASFHCEPKGELLFELQSYGNSTLPMSRSKVMGHTSISLEDYLNPVSKLSDVKWLELVPVPGYTSLKPIRLQVAVSFTVPSPAPHVLHMVRSRTSLKSSCLFPLPGRVLHAKNCTKVVDISDTEVVSLQMRNPKKEKAKETCNHKEVIAFLTSGEERKLAQTVGTGWSLLDSHWAIQFQNKVAEDNHLCELIGAKTVKLFSGRKLDYEPRQCGAHQHHHQDEKNFVTAVEFSAEHPYGEAVALIDLKSGSVKVKKEALVLVLTTAAFILSDIVKTEGYVGFTARKVSPKVEKPTERLENHIEEVKHHQVVSVTDSKEGDDVAEEVKISPLEGGSLAAGGCGGGCGSGCGGCGSLVRSGGCGGGCGGCGGGCGGEDGNVEKSGGCGSGCGGCGGGCGGCGGNWAKGTEKSGAGGCGGCGGGCGGCGGNWAAEGTEKSGAGGCGGCGDGGCGDGVGLIPPGYDNSGGKSCSHGNVKEALLSTVTVA